MREILFKAKRMDNGEWVEGSCVNVSNKHFYIFTGKLDISNGYLDFEKYSINPETLCQYTGLTDKNGNKIWENDVCYYDDMDVCVARFGEYDNNTGHKHVGFYTAWRKYKYMFRSDIGFWVKERELEVIGNIFDNPELMENK